MIERLNIVKKFRTLAIVTCLMAVTSLSAFATEKSLLSNVEIKNTDNGYQVVLQADKSAAVRKVVNSQDDITLTVKGLIPSSSIATVYNDVPDIETVMIQPEDDSTKISIRGKNVASSAVSFAPVSTADAESTTANQKDSTEEKAQISLNQPIMAYAPVYHPQMEENNPESDSMFKTAIALGLDSARCGVPFAKAIVRHILQMNKKLLALCGGFMLIILIGLKALKSGKEDEMKIGLAQSLKNKEMDMEDQLSLRQNSQTLRAQSYQQPAQNRNVPSINYGIKAYQNSQRNPYTSQITGLPKRPVAPVVRKPLPQRKPMPQQSMKQPMAANRLQAQAKANLAKMATAPASLNKVQPEALKTIPGTKSIDSMKFLESMSRIYERSGRADLANELKNNIQNVR